MSNVWTPTNQGRVEKIADLLDKLAVSAASNNADQAMMAMMLAPVIGKLGHMTGGTSQTAPAPPPARSGGDHTQRRDITLWNEAQTAPLAELMMAYTTITSRLTDLVDERKKP